jgi:TonB family protein
MFAMARDGTVLGVWIKTRCGQSILDREAMDTIRRAEPPPPIPATLPPRHPFAGGLRNARLTEVSGGETRRAAI